MVLAKVEFSCIEVLEGTLGKALIAALFDGLRGRVVAGLVLFVSFLLCFWAALATAAKEQLRVVGVCSL